KARVVPAHRLVGLAVEPVEQPVARFADIAAAARNAREEGHERRLPAVRQYDGFGVPALLQRAAKLPAAAELQRAVAKRNGDHFIDLGHAARYRRDPIGGQDVELDSGTLFAQARKQRLRHQGVADPVGCDNQDPWHGSSVSLDGRPFVNVERAAVGTARFAFLRDVEENARMTRPQRRAGQRAMQRQLLLGHLDLLGGVGAHLPFAFTGVSQWRRLRSLPVTTSKNAFWIALVTGPAFPAPTCRP